MLSFCWAKPSNEFEGRKIVFKPLKHLRAIKTFKCALKLVEDCHFDRMFCRKTVRQRNVSAKPSSANILGDPKNSMKFLANATINWNSSERDKSNFSAFYVILCYFLPLRRVFIVKQQNCWNKICCERRSTLFSLHTNYGLN